jgi:hypothetical protein
VLRALILAALLVVAVPPTAEGSCRPHGSKTVRESSVVRVYETPTRYNGWKVFGCAFEAGTPHRLGTNDYDGIYGGKRVAPLHLRGSLVGYVKQQEDRYYSGAKIVVMDLRDGKVSRSYQQSGDTFETCDPNRPPYSVTDLALAPSGAVAWIADVGHCDGSRFEVDALESGAPRALLDDSHELESQSLRYTRGSIFWRHSGVNEERSAPLR